MISVTVWRLRQKMPVASMPLFATNGLDPSPLLVSPYTAQWQAKIQYVSLRLVAATSELAKIFRESGNIT